MILADDLRIFFGRTSDLGKGQSERWSEPCVGAESILPNDQSWPGHFANHRTILGWGLFRARERRLAAQRRRGIVG